MSLRAYCNKSGWELTRDLLRVHFQLDLTRQTHRHMTLQNNITTHQASILLSAWGGCALTRARKNTIDPSVLAECECNAPRQTLDRLLCDFARIPPHTSIHMQAWSQKPASHSVVLSSPQAPEARELAAWRDVGESDCFLSKLEVVVVRGHKMQRMITKWKRLSVHPKLGVRCRPPATVLPPQGGVWRLMNMGCHALAHALLQVDSPDCTFALHVCASRR